MTLRTFGGRGMVERRLVYYDWIKTARENPEFPLTLGEEVGSVKRPQGYILLRAIK